MDRDDQVKELVEEFINELDGWERAYPLSAFPEPDLVRAADLLKAGGMTLDAISASNMRHVASRIAPKAREVATALLAKEEEIARRDALLSDVFDFLGGVDGAVELRGRVLAALEGRS